MGRKIIALGNTVAEWIRARYRGWLHKKKLQRMDDEWRRLEGDCFGGLPPSFFYERTEEEVEQELKELREMIEEAFPDET